MSIPASRRGVRSDRMPASGVRSGRSRASGGSAAATLRTVRVAVAQPTSALALLPLSRVRKSLSAFIRVGGGATRARSTSSSRRRCEGREPSRRPRARRSVRAAFGRRDRPRVARSSDRKLAERWSASLVGASFSALCRAAVVRLTMLSSSWRCAIAPLVRCMKGSGVFALGDML